MTPQLLHPCASPAAGKIQVFHPASSISMDFWAQKRCWAKGCWGFLGKSRLQRVENVLAPARGFPSHPKALTQPLCLRAAPSAANQGVLTLKPNEEHVNYVNCALGLQLCSVILQTPVATGDPSSIISPPVYGGEGDGS